MFKQTKRFLLASVCCLVTLCVAVFFWVSVYMNTKSENAISEIGMIYMSEMSRQIQQKFDAVIGLHLSQAEGIVRLIGPDEADDQELREKRRMQKSADLHTSDSIQRTAEANMYTAEVWRLLTGTNFRGF